MLDRYSLIPPATSYSPTSTLLDVARWKTRQLAAEDRTRQLDRLRRHRANNGSRSSLGMLSSSSVDSVGIRQPLSRSPSSSRPYPTVQHARSTSLGGLHPIMTSPSRPDLIRSPSSSTSALPAVRPPVLQPPSWRVAPADVERFVASRGRVDDPFSEEEELHEEEMFDQRSRGEDSAGRKSPLRREGSWRAGQRLDSVPESGASSRRTTARSPEPRLGQSDHLFLHLLSPDC